MGVVGKFEDPTGTTLEFGIIIEVPILARMFSMSLVDDRGVCRFESKPFGIDAVLSNESGFDPQLLFSLNKLGSTGVVGLEPEPPARNRVCFTSVLE